MAASSSLKNTTWFAELEMEDSMLLHEFVVDCLVDNPPENMETVMHEVCTTLSSSGSDCNSSTGPAGATQTNKNLTDPQDSLKHAGNTTVITPRKRPKRLPEQCQHHIIAERQRRQTLSERFIALSALIPGLKKMDKTSVLAAAIIHMQQLKERIKILEEESNARKAIETFVVIKQPQPIVDNATNNNNNNNNMSTCNVDNLPASRFSNDELPEIEARFSNNNVLIKIHCQMQKGILIKIISELEKLQLLITSSNSMSFSDRTLDITIMTQMEPGFNMRPQDVVQNLRLILN